MSNTQAQEHARGNQANSGQQSRQQRARTFVHEHVREEYDDLRRLLKERVEEMNAHTGGTPQLVLRGSTVELGYVKLHLELDPLPTDPDAFVLTLKVALEKYGSQLLGTGPTPQKERMVAAVSSDVSRILWMHKVEALTSAHVVEFALDLLTTYHSRHMPQTR